MSRPLTDDERRYVERLLARARVAYGVMCVFFTLVVIGIPVVVLMLTARRGWPPLGHRKTIEYVVIGVGGVLIYLLCFFPLVMFFRLARRRSWPGPVETLTGSFQSRVVSDSESSFRVDTIGGEEVSIPEHWRRQLPEGQVVVAEVCHPLRSDGAGGDVRDGEALVLAIAVAVEGGPSIERRVR